MAMTMIRDSDDKVTYTFDKEDEGGFHYFLAALYAERCILRLMRIFDVTFDEAVSMFLSNDRQKLAEFVERSGMRWCG